MKMLVDNFAVLGIESCLVEPLADILSPETIMRLPDETIQEIAAESDDARDERSRAVSKLNSLEAGLRTLNHIRRLRLGGELHLPLLAHPSIFGMD